MRARSLLISSLLLAGVTACAQPTGEEREREAALAIVFGDERGDGSGAAYRCGGDGGVFTCTDSEGHPVLAFEDSGGDVEAFTGDLSRLDSSAFSGETRVTRQGPCRSYVGALGEALSAFFTARTDETLGSAKRAYVDARACVVTRVGSPIALKSSWKADWADLDLFELTIDWPSVDQNALKAACTARGHACLSGPNPVKAVWLRASAELFPGGASNSYYYQDPPVSLRRHERSPWNYEPGLDPGVIFSVPVGTESLTIDLPPRSFASPASRVAVDILVGTQWVRIGSVKRL